MANKIQNSIFEDMIEKLELFERKLNILEDLLYELRLNMKNKKDIENAKNSKTTDIIKKLNVPVKKKRRKKKSIRLPFNNYVLDTESESE
jgi:hypothetical protein